MTGSQGTREDLSDLALGRFITTGEAGPLLAEQRHTTQRDEHGSKKLTSIGFVKNFSAQTL